MREHTSNRPTEQGSAFLRAILLFLVVSFTAYTCLTIAREGPDFFTPFFGGLVEFGWAGQISLDLICFSTMAGLWIAWRHQFSALGLLLGAIGAVAAWVFVGPYMLVASLKARGDVLAFVLGQRRAADLRAS